MAIELATDLCIDDKVRSEKEQASVNHEGKGEREEWGGGGGGGGGGGARASLILLFDAEVRRDLTCHVSLCLGPFF